MFIDKIFITTGTNLIIGLEDIIDWSNNTKSRLSMWRIISFHHEAFFFLFVFVSFISLLVNEIEKLIKYYPIKWFHWDIYLLRKVIISVTRNHEMGKYDEVLVPTNLLIRQIIEALSIIRTQITDDIKHIQNSQTPPPGPTMLFASLQHLGDVAFVYSQRCQWNCVVPEP
jgi:hypothetical protein